MTENEAKEVLNTIILATGFDAFNKPSGVPIPLTKEEIANACNTAIKALDEVQQYRTIGTPEELRSMKENGAFTGIELAQLAAMQMRLKEYEKIGTPKECRAAVEKQNVNKELESHDEKHILECCISLMQEMVNEFAEWYRWQHGEDAIEKLDEEERFYFKKSYFRIVQELFLLGTDHSGGTSTRAKCEQLGVDSAEEIEFDWSDEE